MWLSKKFGYKYETAAETGTVAIGGNDAVKTVSTVQSERVVNYAPYGYSSSPPKGEDILIINGTGGSVSAGTKMANEYLREGEVSVKSKGGAKILLRNDGVVQINTLLISADGKVFNSGKEVVL